MRSKLFSFFDFSCTTRKERRGGPLKWLPIKTKPTVPISMTAKRVEVSFIACTFMTLAMVLSAADMNDCVPGFRHNFCMR